MSNKNAIIKYWKKEYPEHTEDEILKNIDSDCGQGTEILYFPMFIFMELVKRSGKSTSIPEYIADLIIKDLYREN